MHGSRRTACSTICLLTHKVEGHAREITDGVRHLPGAETSPVARLNVISRSRGSDVAVVLVISNVQVKLQQAQPGRHSPHVSLTLQDCGTAEHYMTDEKRTQLLAPLKIKWVRTLSQQKSPTMSVGVQAWRCRSHRNLVQREKMSLTSSKQQAYSLTMSLPSCQALATWKIITA